MLVELPVSTCPRCRDTAHVRPKLIATNFLLQIHFLESFVVGSPRQFRDSTFTLGDYFVSGLFCDRCDLGFLPDSVAHQLGIEPCRGRGQVSLSHRPFGIGFPRSDVSYDDSGSAVRPFEAIIWQHFPGSAGVRVTIHAQNVTEAHQLLVKEHGADAIYSVWNALDTEMPR